MPPGSSPRLLSCRQDGGTAVVTLDDGEILEVASATLPPDLPPPGTPLRPAMLERLRAAAERKRIARRVFALLDRRLHPVAALRRKLAEEGHDAGAVSDVLAEFAARGLHSDRRFADAFCRDTLRRRPVGRRYLLAKLREREVPRTEAEAAVAAALGADREEELARRAAARRWARESAPAGPEALARVLRFLAGRGFDGAVARRAARATAPRPEEDEA